MIVRRRPGHHPRAGTTRTIDPMRHLPGDDPVR